MGARLPSITLILKNGPEPGQAYPVGDRPQTIGRGASNDIVVADRSLSRLHARIRSTPNGYVIEDLGSTNGTFVNDRRVTGPAPVRPGDTIRLGSTIALGIKLQAGGSGPGQAATVISQAPASLSGANPTVMPDATAVKSAPPARTGQAHIPAAPQTRGPQTKAWLWVSVAVLVVALGVGGMLGYLYFSRVPPAPGATEIARPVEAAPPTDTPEPTSTPTSKPTMTATPEPRQVPGLPAAMAREQGIPVTVVNTVDPFCETQIEVDADEAVYIVWSRPLARSDGEIDYLAQWLDSAYYDVTLDGRPLNTLNYERGDGPTLNWWFNLGLLPPGTHYLRIQWSASRPLTNGLDVDPADGQMDTFGPGPAGEGYCEIVVPAGEVAAATPTSKPTPAATPTPAPTFSSEPTTTPTPISAQPAPLGIFHDFESPSNWKRGDQPYGEFTRSAGQVHSGSYAGQLSYDFPSSNNDYVVFLQSRSLAGQPNAISAWVYGDGTGHFLNLWLKDARGQTWGMSFGQVKHTGWQEMTAFIDPSQPWPSGHISGPDNGIIDYPISFQALVLDDGNDSYRGRGTIYIDDLNSQEGVTPSQVGAPAPGSGSGSTGSDNRSGYVLQAGNNHRYEPWGAPWDGDACQAYRENRWNDKVQMRAFHLQLLLTNNSSVPIPDGWVPDYRTAGHKTGQFCYFGYGGDRTTAVMPGATGDVTFFTVVQPGDFVKYVYLPIDSAQNLFLEICLDGSGAQVPCQ